MNKEQRKVYEVVARITAVFLLDERASQGSCGVLGEAVGNVLNAEYGTDAGVDYLEVSIPIVLGEAEKRIATEEKSKCPTSIH